VLVRQFDGDVASAPHYTPDQTMFTFELDTYATCANVVTMDVNGNSANVLPHGNGDVARRRRRSQPTGSRSSTRAITASTAMRSSA
jgi:hypothetical protein